MKEIIKVTFIPNQFAPAGVDELEYNVDVKKYDEAIDIAKAQLLSDLPPELAKHYDDGKIVAVRFDVLETSDAH